VNVFIPEDTTTNASADLALNIRPANPKISAVEDRKKAIACYRCFRKPCHRHYDEAITHNIPYIYYKSRDWSININNSI
jgi:hypothetical protein